MDKEKWFNDVFNSMKDSQPAKPNLDLFLKIEEKFNDLETRMVSISHWRLAGVAAVFLFVLNAFALRQVFQGTDSNASELVADDVSNLQLFSDYKIYD